MTPEDGSYELQQSNNVKGSSLCTWRLAIEKEIEKFKADGVTLDI